MCRWLAYLGDPIFLECLISTPKHSLLMQSMRCKESHVMTNGDGFGLAWYDQKQEPGLYREILPAWSNENLKSLAQQIKSPLFFAHVRAATGTPTIRPNCHPFVVGGWTFMHNGQVDHYDRIRRRVEMQIPDALYAHRYGSTDSEALFLMMLADGLETDPLGAASRVIGFLEEALDSLGLPISIRFTAALTDGKRIYAIRYSSDHITPTLYFRKCGKGITIVSEPLDDDDNGGEWIKVPEKTALIADHKGLLETVPFTSSRVASGIKLVAPHEMIA
jgi:predicted glutamine amidotransferase